MGWNVASLTSHAGGGTPADGGGDGPKAPEAKGKGPSSKAELQKQQHRDRTRAHELQDGKGEDPEEQRLRAIQMMSGGSAPSGGPVFANNRGIIHGKSGGTQIAAIPNVCKIQIPGPPGFVPTPLGAMTRDANVKNGTTKTFINGASVSVKGAYLSSGTLDEPAKALGGIISNVQGGKSMALMQSQDTKYEDRGVNRLGDPQTHNGNQSNTGATPMMQQAGVGAASATQDTPKLTSVNWWSKRLETERGACTQIVNLPTDKFNKAEFMGETEVCDRDAYFIVRFSGGEGSKKGLPFEWKLVRAGGKDDNDYASLKDPKDPSLELKHAKVYPPTGWKSPPYTDKTDEDGTKVIRIEGLPGGGLDTWIVEASSSGSEPQLTAPLTTLRRLYFKFFPMTLAGQLPNPRRLPGPTTAYQKSTWKEAAMGVMEGFRQYGIDFREIPGEHPITFRPFLSHPMDVVSEVVQGCDISAYGDYAIRMVPLHEIVIAAPFRYQTDLAFDYAPEGEVTVRPSATHPDTRTTYPARTEPNYDDGGLMNPMTLYSGVWAVVDGTKPAYKLPVDSYRVEEDGSAIIVQKKALVDGEGVPLTRHKLGFSFSHIAPGFHGSYNPPNRMCYFTTASALGPRGDIAIIVNHELGHALYMASPRAGGDYYVGKGGVGPHCQKDATSNSGVPPQEANNLTGYTGGCAMFHMGGKLEFCEVCKRQLRLQPLNKGVDTESRQWTPQDRQPDKA